MIERSVTRRSDDGWERGSMNTAGWCGVAFIFGWFGWLHRLSQQALSLRVMSSDDIMGSMDMGLPIGNQVIWTPSPVKGLTGDQYTNTGSGVRLLHPV